MQGSVKTAGRILLTGALAALAGCGGSDVPEVEYTHVRLQEIRHYSVNSSGVQTQLWRQLFSYLDKSTPDKMVYYNGKGADAAWNTADDTTAYYVACAYSGKAATAPATPSATTVPVAAEPAPAAPAPSVPTAANPAGFYVPLTLADAPVVAAAGALQIVR